MTPDTPTARTPVEPQALENVVVRFVGDSGDGMQLTGGHFTTTSALFGNDIATFPDFPAEIRAPRGTTFGVSGFQVHFSSNEIFTPGDNVNAMVAMNPAALKTNIHDVEPGGTVIVNEDEFTKVNLKKCGYREGYNPLEDEELLTRFRVFPIPMSRLTRESLTDSGMGVKDIDRCRNMYALGLMSWLFGRSLDPIIENLEKTFGELKKKPEIAALNVTALKAGFFFGETAEIFTERYAVAPARQRPGLYRRISGNEATALGFVTAAYRAGKQLLYASYPITPASDIIHGIARLKHFGAKTFQAEDEIAAISAAIGAAFAGDFALTGTSGPGLALKSEALGLAVSYELPLVLINVQRAGPATGMPTKTEQADLLQSMYGRTSESPVIIVAPQSPADCFDMAIEAFRLAVRCMCPVIFLSDGYIANGAEPWLIPDVNGITPIEVHHPAANETTPGPAGDGGNGGFRPYARDPETLARPWAIPGTAGLEHRIGGLEKDDGTGNVSYDADNHDHMCRTRAAKVQRAASVIPPLEVHGPESGEVLLLGWGGTYGTIYTAAEQLRAKGQSVSNAHLRYLNPFPSNLGDVLSRFRTVIIPEINLGQLRTLIRDRYLVDAVGINEMRGRMFRVDFLVRRTLKLMRSEGGAK